MSDLIWAKMAPGARPGSWVAAENPPSRAEDQTHAGLSRNDQASVVQQLRETWAGCQGLHYLRS